jgi:hypothetical protein
VQIGHQGRAEFLTHVVTLVGGTSIDIALDVEQFVDVLHRFQAER